MLQSLTGESNNLTNTDTIEQKLQGCLQEGRYLLVLDDVWNTNQKIWDSIKASLLRVTKSCTSSLVLVTTQRYEVTSVMKAYMIRTLGTLSEDDAWKLFEKKAFQNKNPQQVAALSDIGKRILRKCGGLPLAINTLGSSLGLMNDRSKWEIVDKSEVWNLPEGQTQIIPSLLLSFNHLPSASLKQCFAYCAVVLSKGTVIGGERLVYCWMVQGFIQPSDTSYKGVMDMGQQYIQSLLNNGLLHLRHGTNYLCMHDLMYDLALYICRDKYLIVKEPNDLRKSFLGVEYVSILGSGHDTWNSPQNFLKGDAHSTLRTLICWNVPISLDLIAQARLLRTLGLTNCGLKEIPGSIGRLKHLRILDLTNNPLEYLPESIGRLYSLQVLVLNDCSRLVELPQQITKLLDLRIIATTKPVHIPKGMGQLTCLARLPAVKLKAEDGFKINELRGLQHLIGEIEATQLENIPCKGDAVDADLISKNGITSMRLAWSMELHADDTNCYSDEEVLEGLQPHSNLRSLSVHNFRGMKFSDWLSKGFYCTNLTNLTLLNCKRCEQLPTLGRLPSLMTLLIDGLESVEVIGNNFSDREATVFSSNESTSNCFPRLKKFSLCNMPKLKDWFDPSNLPASSFPCLEELNIVKCPLLVSAPSCFHSILQLTIIGVNSGEFVLMILNNAYKLSSLVVENVLHLTLLSDPLLKCTRLQTIRISGCKELAGLPPTLRSLCYLQKLAIEECDSLTSLPDIEGLLTLTTLDVYCCKNVTQAPCGLASCVSISVLQFINCPKLKFLLDLRSLSCLRSLSLCSLSDECSVPRWINHLSSLKHLFIGGFNQKLDHFGGIDHLPTCLRSLILYGWPKLNSLPVELQSLTQLESLSLFCFEGVIALPEWLGKLTSLQKLKLLGFHNMKSLPTAETMHSLSQLTKLCIEYCPLLEERCRPDGGEERLKVAAHTKILFE